MHKCFYFEKCFGTVDKGLFTPIGSKLNIHQLPIRNLNTAYYYRTGSRQLLPTEIKNRRLLFTVPVDSATLICSSNHHPQTTLDPKSFYLSASDLLLYSILEIVEPIQRVKGLDERDKHMIGRRQ